MPLSDADIPIANAILYAPDAATNAISEEQTSLAGYKRPLVTEVSSPTVNPAKKVRMTYTYVNPDPLSANWGALASLDLTLI
jgi:hypothetical protein